MRPLHSLFLLITFYCIGGSPAFSRSAEDEPLGLYCAEVAVLHTIYSARPNTFDGISENGRQILDNFAVRFLLLDAAGRWSYRVTSEPSVLTKSGETTDLAELKRILAEDPIYKDAVAYHRAAESAGPNVRLRADHLAMFAERIQSAPIEERRAFERLIGEEFRALIEHDRNLKQSLPSEDWQRLEKALDSSMAADRATIERALEIDHSAVAENVSSPFGWQLSGITLRGGSIPLRAVPGLQSSPDRLVRLIDTSSDLQYVLVFHEAPRLVTSEEGNVERLDIADLRAKLGTGQVKLFEARKSTTDLRAIDKDAALRSLRDLPRHR